MCDIIYERSLMYHALTNYATGDPLITPFLLAIYYFTASLISSVRKVSRFSSLESDYVTASAQSGNALK
jgi:hypothetical protein